jgi:hypothetical protein
MRCEPSSPGDLPRTWPILVFRLEATVTGRPPATVLDRHLRRRRCRSVEDVPVRRTRTGTARLLRGPGLLQLRHPHAIVSSSEASSELGPLLL